MYMIPLRSVKISGHVKNLAVKYHATENTSPRNSVFIGHASNPP
jgi:hypothetical protein